MNRWYALLVPIAIAGCGQAPATITTANIGCPAATVLERLQPGVDFVLDRDSADARAIPSWRAAVGPPVADRAGRSCEDAAIDSLLVVSWNVHIGHAQIARFVSDLRGGRVIPGVNARHFVLLLQEAYRKGNDVPAHASANACPARMGGEGPDIADVSDSLNLALFYVPAMRNGCKPGDAREDRGNAILSTLPLTQLKAIELPLVRQRRVAALAQIQGHTSTGSNWTLALASLHLENRGPGRPRDWIQGRARQAQAFVAALPESDLAVVGGDFNTLNGATEPAVRIVGARFANTAAHPRRNTFVGYMVVRSHLDYLFFHCASHHRATYWRARERYGSDHYPIMGFVKLN